MALKITCDSKSDRFKVYINDILHISVVLKGLQVNSWKKNDNWFCIEFITKSGAMLCEYNSEEKWKTILEFVDKEI